jgi:hypothetical protein
LTLLPAEIGQLVNLTVLDLRENPILPHGENENMWGREELRAHFGDRVVMDDPNKLPPMNPNTTKEQVYRPLDAHPLHINREVFKNAHVPEIPGEAIDNGQDFMYQFSMILKTLNFSHENQEGYLSFDLLAGDYASDAKKEQGLSNADKIFKFIIPRLSGYFKALYAMPLEPGESSGWQMYDDQKPALKKALSFILRTLQDTKDPGLRSALFYQFVEGMIHCPTGQKEGVDTVVLSLLEGKKVISTDLRSILSNVIGLRKNALFKTAILAKGASNTQNVHLISFYEGKLKDELGLSNILGYKEKMGILGKDPFSGNPNNVLQVFYQLATPQRIVNWFMDKVQTPADIELRQKLEALSKEKVSAGQTSQELALLKRAQGLREKLTDPQTSDESKKTIEAQLKLLEGMLSKQAGQQAQSQKTEAEKKALSAEIDKLKNQIKIDTLFRPITTTIVMEYLVEQMGIDTKITNWWMDYFAMDPIQLENQTATLTREGALRILIHMGYIISKGEKK